MAEKKKFYRIEVPLMNRQIELFGNSLSSFNNQTVKLDLTRMLRGKSIEAVLLIFTAQNEWIATYCHKVFGFTWGYIFIPFENGNHELGFVYRNKYGKIEIVREVQI